MAKKDNRVGIYARLSKEDKRAGESVSIENQVLMMSAHVRSQGWELVETYRDDGFTGTNQNRPELQRVMADIRQKRINILLIKDLSRLGRNYLEVGTLSEVFLPEHGCKLISLSEPIDDTAVFRNVFNEIYSKDTSKKVRAVKRMCAQNGKYVGTYVPYGYQRDPENKHRFVIDENTAPIVRKMYALRNQGSGYKAIASHLNESGIIPPRDYYYQQKNRPNPGKTSNHWNDRSVKAILDNEVYIGNIVQGKVGTVSYKNNKMVAKPKDEWIRAEGTHEALVDRETWEMAQRIAEKRYQPRPQKNGKASVFSGLLYCTDCGSKMRLHTKFQYRKNGDRYYRTTFICGRYARCGKTACTAHTIGEDILHALVSEQIRMHAQMVNCEEDRIIEGILRMQSNESEASRSAYQNELKAHKTRLSMLERLIEKLYEDRLDGVVPETVFRGLLQKYEQERMERAQAAESLESQIRSIRENTNGAVKWINLIREYASLETLDAHALLLLVDRIEISDAAKEDGKAIRDVKVVYNYVGDLAGLEMVSQEPSREEAAAYERAV